MKNVSKGNDKAWDHSVPTNNGAAVAIACTPIKNQQPATTVAGASNSGAAYTECMVPLSSITKDPELQLRVKTSESTVQRYRDVLRDGGKLAPITLFEDPETKVRFLADGWHTTDAHFHEQKTEVLARIYIGNKDAALRYAASANVAHGLPFTNADRWKAVMTFLKKPEYQNRSNREIAEICRVSDPFVGKVRKQFEETTATVSSSVRVGKDGKARKVKPKKLAQTKTPPSNTPASQPAPLPAPAESGPVLKPVSKVPASEAEPAGQTAPAPVEPPVSGADVEDVNNGDVVVPDTPSVDDTPAQLWIEPDHLNQIEIVVNDKRILLVGGGVENCCDVNVLMKAFAVLSNAIASFADEQNGAAK